MKTKRILSLMLIATMLLTSIAVFAAETGVKIELEKFTFAPNEKMHVKISGLTDEQIAAGAVVQVAEKRFDHYNSGTYEKVSNLKDGVWEPIAPYEVRTFAIRVYSSNTYSKETFLGSETFIIRGEPVLLLVEGTNGISSWAINDVQNAIFDKLTTDKVLFDFKKNITREEFCEIVVKMYEKATSTVAESADESTFTDTKNDFILKAYKLGVVKGVGDGLFNPNAPITRQEIASMLYRAVKVIAPDADYAVSQPIAFGDNEVVASWAKESVDYFAYKEIIKGDGLNFKPLDNCSCEQAIALIKRIYDSYKK